MQSTVFEEVGCHQVRGKVLRLSYLKRWCKRSSVVRTKCCWTPDGNNQTVFINHEQDNVTCLAPSCSWLMKPVWLLPSGVQQNFVRTTDDLLHHLFKYLAQSEYFSLYLMTPHFFKDSGQINSYLLNDFKITRIISIMRTMIRATMKTRMRANLLYSYKSKE